MHHTLLQSACMQISQRQEPRGKRIPRPIYSPSGALISRRRQWQHDNGIWIRWWHAGSKRRPAGSSSGGHPPMPVAAGRGRGRKARPALRRSCAQQNARSFCMGARARTEEQQPSLSLAAVRTPEERLRRAEELLQLLAGLTLIDRSNKTRKKGKFLQ